MHFLSSVLVCDEEIQNRNSKKTGLITVTNVDRKALILAPFFRVESVVLEGSNPQPNTFWNQTWVPEIIRFRIQLTNAVEFQTFEVRTESRTKIRTRIRNPNLRISTRRFESKIR